MKLSLSHRFVILRLDINGLAYTPFEINLPSNIKKVTGLVITNSVGINTFQKLGTLCLQSQDESDVFFCDELYTNTPFNDDPLLNLEFNITTRNRPWDDKRKPLSIEVNGDTTKITGWYKATYLAAPYWVKITLEYEEVAKLIEDSAL
jgi:hypothetical protein